MELHAYEEPELPVSLSSLSLVLPHAEIRGLRNVLERMKLFADYVLLTAEDSCPTPAEQLGAPAPHTAQLKLQDARRA